MSACIPDQISIRHSVQSATDRRKREEAGHPLVWCTRYIDVYNVCQIDNLPPFDSDHIHKDVKADGLIWDIAEGMNVPLYMDTLDESYYHPGLDEVHVPLQERFKTSAGCSHTCAHELAHASGHKKRLNYLEPLRFGSEDYAKEELRAEISACLISAYTNEGLGQLEFENSNAYLDSWLTAVKDRPEEVVAACRRAAKTVDYMLAGAGYADAAPEADLPAVLEV